MIKQRRQDAMLETSEAKLVGLGDRPEDVLEIIAAGEDPSTFAFSGISPGSRENFTRFSKKQPHSLHCRGSLGVMDMLPQDGAPWKEKGEV